MKRNQFLVLAAALLAIAGVMHASANQITTLDQRLNETSTTVDALAVSGGDQTVAATLSTGLDVNSSALLLQHSELGGTWGDLLVSHELSQASRTGLVTGIAPRQPVTTERIFALRSQGMSWSQIMAVLRISPARLSGELANDLATMGITPTTSGARTLRTGRAFRTTDGETVNGGGSVTEDGTTTVRVADDGTSVSSTADGRTTRGEATEQFSNGFSRNETGIDRNLEEQVNRLDAEAERRGDVDVADRLATEVGVSADVLRDQRDAFDADWGDLLIAYTALQQSRVPVTIGQVFDLRESGMSWFQIAKTLRIPPGRLMTQVRGETNSLVGTTTSRSNRSVAKSTSFSKRTVNADRANQVRAAKLERVAAKAAPTVRRGNAAAHVPTAGMNRVGTRVTATQIRTGAMATRTTMQTIAATRAAQAQAMRVQGAAGGGRGRR